MAHGIFLRRISAFSCLQKLPNKTIFMYFTINKLLIAEKLITLIFKVTCFSFCVN